MLHPVALGALQLAVLGLPALGFAWLLRRAAIPGGAPTAAIVGGLLAGLLVGATIAGHAAPETHDRLFVGGVDEAIAAMALQSKHERARAALAATGVSPEAQPELAAAQDAERSAAIERVTQAQAQHELRLAFAASAPLVLLCAWGAGSALRRQPRGSMLTALVGVALAAAASGMVARLIGLSWATALILALALAVPGVTAGRLVAALVIAGAAWIGAAPFEAWTPTTVLACAMLVGTLLGAAARLARGRLSMAMAHRIAGPACVAILAATVDLPELVTQARFWWLLLLGVLAASDLRWVCYYAAIRGLSHAPWVRAPWSQASRWMREGATSAQLVITYVAFALDRSMGAVVAASLAGAALVELTSNVRSRIAAALDRRHLAPADREDDRVS